MTIARIVKVENGNVPEILTSKCSKVEKVTDDVKEVVKDLLDIVVDPKSAAAGLSAPQIGIPLRICVARKFDEDSTTPDEALEESKEYVLINPEITSFSNKKDTGWEGCLSIPDTYGKVQRSHQISVVALDENGKRIKLKAKGYFARVIQHEVDHLNGILFTSKVIGNTVNEDELEKLERASRNM